MGDVYSLNGYVRGAVINLNCWKGEKLYLKWKMLQKFSIYFAKALRGRNFVAVAKFRRAIESVLSELVYILIQYQYEAQGLERMQLQENGFYLKFYSVKIIAEKIKSNSEVFTNLLQRSTIFE